VLKKEIPLDREDIRWLSVRTLGSTTGMREPNTSAESIGAVVAREYGIPAVVGVPGVTGRIRTGQRVTVDGTAGRVVVAES